MSDHSRPEMWKNTILNFSIRALSKSSELFSKQRLGSAVAVILTARSLIASNQYPRSIARTSFWTRLKILLLLQILPLTRIVESGLNIFSQVHLLLKGSRPTGSSIDENSFLNEVEFERVLNRVGGCGARLTGSETHNKLIGWLDSELRQIPGLTIETADIDILRWQPDGDRSLHDIGKLMLDGHNIPIAGAVPFSLPTKGQSGELLYLSNTKRISQHNVEGKIVLRDFPSKPIPYVLGRFPSYSQTPDLAADSFSAFDRPGLADQPLHEDLLDAGEAGAAGVIFMFDIVREQLESYFDPHKGTHYKVPALYVGVDERIMLKERAASSISTKATISIAASISESKTRNLTAVLPGQIPERIIYLSHTDGNTYVQENGPVALLALAKHFASLPITSRRRTLEFAFNTGHLHISREGSHGHATALDASFDRDKNVALVIPIEHLGTKEIEAVPRADRKPGRELKYSGRGEVMFWCTGPSPAVVQAVKTAVRRRKLDRVMITRGVSTPNPKQVPTFTSFGGIGTYYHNMLVPTTTLISGPWSLWAPSFGAGAVDVGRLRQQTLAIGDVYLAVDGLSRDVIVGGYKEYRERRAKGVQAVVTVMPPQKAEDAQRSGGKGVVVY